MAESPNVDEFIRHMQAEYDLCNEIVDKVEREKKQWRIEAALMEAIEFSERFKELSKLGQNPIQIVQALTSPDAANPNVAKQVVAMGGGLCPSCGVPMDEDLDFCSNCGDYLK